MIQSVTFIIIGARAAGCIPPSFRIFSLRLIRLFLAESVQKIFLTFVYSCSVSHIMESERGILSHMIICKSPPLFWSFASIHDEPDWLYRGRGMPEIFFFTVFTRGMLPISNQFFIWMFFLHPSVSLDFPCTSICHNHEKWGFLCFLCLKLKHNDRI